MNLIFDPQAWDDYQHFAATDRRMLERLNGLIRECSRTPFAGTGKPEPLRGPLSGRWSRRLTQEHRLVHRMAPNCLQIAQCRHHY